MANFEWVLKSESDTEKIYEIKNLSEYVRVCSPAENYQLNDRNEILKRGLSAGYYIVKDIHQQKKYNASDNEDVARVAYKENSDKKFVDMGLSIRLQPLFNFVSECLNGDKLRYKKNPNGLIDKIIRVHSCDLVDSEYNGQKSKVTQVKWSFISEQKTDEEYLGDDPDSMGLDDFGSMDPEDLYDPENIDPEELFDPENIDPEELFDPENMDPELIDEEGYID